MTLLLKFRYHCLIKIVTLINFFSTGKARYTDVENILPKNKQ